MFVDHVKISHLNSLQVHSIYIYFPNFLLTGGALISTAGDLSAEGAEAQEYCEAA